MARFDAIESELLSERHLSGGYSMMNFVLTQDAQNLGVNHMLMGLLAVIMITAAIKYLKN